MSSSTATSTTTTFGSYDLLEKVATGGMAEVYRARARRPGGVTKVVCLKRIHPSLCADPSFVDMFVEEARLGLNLSHGNIVPVFDFGCIDGYHYLVMDFVEGHDLAEVLARTHIVSRPFPKELAVYVIIEVLEGLAYAHGRKDEDQRPIELVHRDVSPSNVMISTAGEVKILDFGIARSALREFHTRTGVVKGKPGYMAPEQERGDPIDSRVDIFACGVMLRELVTGERPSRDGLSDRPSSSEKLNEDNELTSIIDQALDTDPEARFQSAGEMRDALYEVLEAFGARPQPSELAEFVDSLFEAQAAVPDWSHQGDAVDRHLAAIIDEQIARSNDSTPTPTDPLANATTEPMILGERTESLPSAPSHELQDRPKRSWTLPAFVVSGLILIIGGMVMWIARDHEPDPEPSEPRAVVTAPALPAPRIEIRTEPRGASIVVDDVPTDETTPAVLTLDEGMHRIELRLAGFAPLTRVVEAEAGQRVVFDTVLTPTPVSLVVTSTPSKAVVRLNGIPRGETPLTIEGLDRQRSYRVEIEKAGFEVWERALSIGDDDRMTVDADLRRTGRPGPDGEGFLSVVASPWAEVLLDGQSIGETPIIRRTVRSGRHVLVLRNEPRGAEVRRIVIVPVDEEARVSVDLTQGQR